MKGRITIEGIPELQKALNILGRDMGRMIADSLMVGVMPLNDRWKENIVNYPLVDTGTYLRSVHTEVLNVGADYAEVSVGTNLTDPPYPYFLEFGTWRMTPKGVARAALDTTRGEVTAETERAFRYLLSRRLP